MLLLESPILYFVALVVTALFIATGALKLWRRRFGTVEWPDRPNCEDLANAYQNAANSRWFECKMALRRKVRKMARRRVVSTSDFREAVATARFPCARQFRSAFGAAFADENERIVLTGQRWLMPRPSAYHELVHVYQQLEWKALTLERNNQITGLQEVWAELDAHLFGSTIYFVLLLLGGVAGLAWILCLLNSLMAM